MEFWTSVRVLRRRWYVLVPCLVVFAMAAGLVVKKVKPSYQASGSIVFLPTQAGTATDPNVNPYQALDSSTAIFANVIAQDLVTNTFKDSLVAAGASPTYTVTPPVGSTPVLALSTTAATPEAALHSYHLLIRALDKELIVRQTGVATPGSFIKESQIAQPQHATEIIGAKIKALIVVVAIGLIVSLGLTFLADSMLLARARNKQSEEEAEPSRAAEKGEDDALDLTDDPEDGSGDSPGGDDGEHALLDLLADSSFASVSKLGGVSEHADN